MSPAGSSPKGAGRGRRLVVEADGGSRGNPGNAGYGAVVRDAATGEVLAQRAASVGIASNNVAEYSGLVAGLKAALEVDPAADVHVRMDSKLVVEQMSGRWQIKHEDMRRLAAEARAVIERLRAGGGSVRYEWIPRAMNSAADALANAAMDGQEISTGAPVSPDDVPAEVTAAPLPVAGEPTRIVLVRHGVTDFTVAGKLDGRGGADPSLNALGRAQADAAGVAVRAYLDGRGARVVTSSLSRAVETGAAVARALEVEPLVDPDWDEQSFGDWDGRTFGSLVAGSASDVVALRDDPTYARPGGETHRELEARVLPAFERVVRAGGATVVATHRKPLIVVLAHLLGIPHDRVWRLATQPASLTAIEIGPEAAMTSVAFVNDTGHLREVNRLGGSPS